MGRWLYALFPWLEPRTEEPHDWRHPSYNQYIRRCTKCGRSEMYFMRSRFAFDDPAFKWQGFSEDKGCKP
jgi:hypothetical protein